MFTVVSWNVENFFAPADGAGAGYDAKVTALAQVITDSGADVVALQEVGDPESLEQLRSTLGARWHGILAGHFDPDHAIRVGFLSRREPQDVEEVVDLPAELVPVTVDDDGTTTTTLGRGALVASFDPGDGPVVRILTAHLKSKLLSFPGGRFSTENEDERARYAVYALHRRAAEAAAVRAWATRTLASGSATARVVVCGDLNDTSEAATTQLLFGPPGSQIGTGGFPAADEGDRQRLWDVGYAMTAPDDFSRINQGRRELIDHVLVSHALVGRLDHATTVPLERLPTVGERPRTTPRAAGQAPSDHRPVLAAFSV